MKRTSGRRAAATQPYGAAAWRWPLAVLYVLLLLAGGSFAQDGLTRPISEKKRPAEASTTLQAPDLNEAVSSIPQPCSKTAGRAAIRERSALRKRR